MKPFTKSPDKEIMGGTEEAYKYDMPSGRFRRWWADMKRKTRRKRRRKDRQELEKDA